MQLIATNVLGVRGSEDDISAEAADLLGYALADNTLRAYRADLDHFLNWGGSIPTTTGEICSYIGEQARQLSVATIRRRIATLSKVHELRALSNPCRSEMVRATLRGLARKHGSAQRQARPLLRDDLFLVLDGMAGGLRGRRDRALFLLGFAGGFRRSEIVGLEVEDIEPVRQGLVVTLRGSKTDQERVGRRIGIPHGRSRHCPVAAVEAWLAISEIKSGPVFRPVTRHGQITQAPLSGDAVSVLLRERLAAVGIDSEGYSGHSLRAGFATSAAQAGISTLKIRAQTGHASEAVLSRYIRDGELFIGNAAGILL
ncbi:site-specific integrase [Pelagibacterium mangrovi]|uniref:site-specific integrase n=1 Tax=Pelagibacterium mangrovi TaxID=3119828 RepID=UPI002FCBE13E